MTKDDNSKALIRQRKTHRKSRLGCANCKLRGVKCDESKPSCARCNTSGLSCTYSSLAPTLQPSYESVFTLSGFNSSPSPPPASFQRVIPVALSASGSVGDYEMRQGDMALVSRFVNDTVLTFGPPGDESMHRDRSLVLANAHPYLFHVFVGFAQLHQSHLNVTPGSPTPSNSASMAFHWYHSAILFKQKLGELLRKKTLTSTERDALWMGASMLATSTFTNIDSLDPREVWPLRSADTMDLDWLRMTDGKDIVWQVADLGRPDSLFHGFFQDMIAADLPSGRSPVRPHSISPLFYDLFNITPDSTPATNPYHAAVSFISQVIGDSNDILVGRRLFGFAVEIGEPFKDLLRSKDPRSLLLLVYWHSKLAQYAWWAEFRGIIEGLSVCMYLRRYHADQTDILRLLEPPRQALLHCFRKSKLVQVWSPDLVDEAEGTEPRSRRLLRDNVYDDRPV